MLTFWIVSTPNFGLQNNRSLTIIFRALHCVGLLHDFIGTIWNKRTFSLLIGVIKMLASCIWRSCYKILITVQWWKLNDFKNTDIIEDNVTNSIILCLNIVTACFYLAIAVEEVGGSTKNRKMPLQKRINLLLHPLSWD